MGGPVIEDETNRAVRPGSSNTTKGSAAGTESAGGDQPAAPSQRITDAVLLCGGQGSRLGGTTEKPLVTVGDRPMIARVVDALTESRIRRIVAVSSPHTPSTTTWLRDTTGIDDHIVGSGSGYVADLQRGLECAEGPAITVTADLPFLDSDDIDDAIETAERLAGDVAIHAPTAIKRDLGVSVDTVITQDDGTETAPTGLNVVWTDETDEHVVVWPRESLAVNVNRPQDLVRARQLARDR